MNLIIMFLGLSIIIVCLLMPGDQIAGALLGGAIFGSGFTMWRDEKKYES